jgi:hypothetical protein
MVTMSKLLEFFLGSILIAVFTVAFIFFSALHYILRPGDAADCAWQGQAKAWLDMNRDGLIDSGEPPLSNIEIYIRDVQHQLFDIRWPVFTGKDGDVQFDISLPGCSNTVFEISVEIPEGYQTTTSSRIEVDAELSSPDAPAVYYFGFVSDH